jgi:hypothetical protein
MCLGASDACAACQVHCIGPFAVALRRIRDHLFDCTFSSEALTPPPSTRAAAANGARPSSKALLQHPQHSKTDIIRGLNICCVSPGQLGGRRTCA